MNTAKSREERLAEQLRANLRRRKVQARALSGRGDADREDQADEPPLSTPAVDS
jgi:hypothetical protein